MPDAKQEVVREVGWFLDWLAQPVRVLAAVITLVACGCLLAGLALPFADGWALAYLGTLALIGLRKALRHETNMATNRK